jgi:hypothetical protein
LRSIAALLPVFAWIAFERSIDNPWIKLLCGVGAFVAACVLFLYVPLTKR